MNGYSYDPGWYVPAEKKKLTVRIKETLSAPERKNLITVSTLAGGGVIAYYVLSNIYGVILRSVPLFAELYKNERVFKLLAEMLYSMFCVALPFLFVLLIMRRLGVYRKDLPYGRPRGGIRVYLLVSAGLGMCFAGNIASNIVYTWAKGFGIDFFSYSEALANPTPLPGSVPMAVLMILHTALMPALMEEFVFRGVVMQPLRQYGDWFAIIVSGVMFGIIHGNMMQTPFAVIAGIALGYSAVVTGSIWTSVIIHFLNNAISVFHTCIMQSVEGPAAFVCSALVLYGFILVGIISFCGYVFENRNFARLRYGKYPGLKHKADVFFLMPTTLVSIILMLILTLNDIRFL